MSSEFDREALVGIFVTEASDGMAALSAVLDPPDGTVPLPRTVQEHYIIAHRVRGAASIYGFTGLARLGELLETVLEQAPNIPHDRWGEALDLLRNLVQGFRDQVQLIAQGGEEDQLSIADWAGRCATLLPEHSENESPPDEDALSEEYLLPVLDEEVWSYFAQEAQDYMDRIESLARGLRQAPDDKESVQSLFRAAHTLKGSAQTVGFAVVGDIAHPLEDCLIAVREGRAAVTHAFLECVAQAAEVMRTVMRRDSGCLAQLRRDVPDVIAKLRGCFTAQPLITSAGAAAEAERSAVSSPESPDFSAVYSDDYLIPALDPEVLSYFSPEAQEYLEAIEAVLLRLEKDPNNPELIHQLFRSAHTLKGSAYTVGFQSIGDLTHHIEDFMGSVREGRLRILPGHTDVLLRAIDVVRLLMRRDPSSLGILRQRFTSAMDMLKRLEQAVLLESPVPSEAAQVPVVEEPAPGFESGKPGDAKAGPGEEREVIRVSRDRLERLLNLVGELVIGRGRLEQRLRVLEQLSMQVLACKSRLVEAVHSFEEKHAFTLPASSTAADAAGPAFPGLSDFGSLEFDKYDDFNILARRISEVTADISESMSQLSGSIRRSHDDMSQLQQLTLAMRDEIARARMVPIGSPFTRFRRAVREMARSTGKEVALVTSGEHTEVDTGVVERLVDPLIHLVRNAVYHGIEPAAERIAKGKPAVGTVYLHAAHRGSAVVIEIEDDGAGLDLDKIRTKAGTLGLVKPEVAQKLSDAEALKFIFFPGFSTADRVGDQAGRGVGLDVVKRAIEGMNGQIDVESIRGIGTKFTLHLPLTLLIATALMVREGSDRYAIPLPSVREVTMPTAGSLQQLSTRTLLHLGDEAVEVQPLRQLLRHESGTVATQTPVVIVRTAVGPFGIAVEELLGRQEIVIKSLGNLRPLEKSCFGGATIDPEGRVILVLDPSRLIARDQPDAAALPTASEDELLPGPELPTESPEDQEAVGHPILLIDDSLSIRKFVGRMLENGGYQVDTAVDGEEGLRKAAAQNYRLIITDLEMPKLNGYEVIQALRGRPQTQTTPIVVMTTRAGDKHRQMAINTGASSYIAKPVEERALIQEVERWLGKDTPARR